MNDIQNEKANNQQQSARFNKQEDYQLNSIIDFQTIITNKIQIFQNNLNQLVNLIQGKLLDQRERVEENDFFEEILLYCQPYLENKINECQQLIELKQIQLKTYFQNCRMKQEVKIPTEVECQTINNLKSNRIQIELKQVIKQEEICCTLIINKSNTILISGSGEQIKLWKIKDGEIQNNPLILIGHTQIVTSLLYSDNERYFISGSYDGNIRLWRKAQPNIWSSKNYFIHQQGVFGLLLSKINQQIISFGKDSIINIIQCCTNYELKISQKLNKHQTIINCVCINESESVLASSDDQKQIIIWVKDEKFQWQFKQIVNQSTNDFFTRMVFVDNYLICQQWSQPISQVFNEQDGYYKQRVDLQINLSEQICDEDLLFPSIYHKKTGILIQKYGKYVYILKLQKEFQFIQACSPIDCFDPYNYGNLIEDGRLLLIWNDYTKEIRIYELNLF
ncbi:unnamed protein product [Paramecium sonneborni]|uniref:WD40-repeat-containing domain n=1 Tax=Paramecium sonneborni TaxID=65129 RepID=A0A8S1NWN0_9CILI|nr:unnamed protein product [Paramecium sonneborni]